MTAPPKIRGRPKGARTRFETQGVKYARDYFALIDAGRSKGAAAKATAKKWGVAVTTVLKARQRHEKRLVDEINRQTDELLHRAGLMFANTYRNPDARRQMRELRLSLGAAQDRTIAELERRGAPVAAAAMRAWWREHADEVLYRALGVVHLTAYRRHRIRNIAGG